MCEALDVSRSGFYQWLKNKQSEPSLAQLEKEKLKKSISRFFHLSLGTYGAPRIQKDLKENGGEISERRVGRIMSELGLYATPLKFRAITTDSNHSNSIFRNLLRQNFETDKANQVWVSDITYIWTSEGTVYLSAVMDLFSRKIVGWKVTDHLRTEGPLEALEMAIIQRKPSAGLIHHSDRGSQYASNNFQARLSNIQAKCSMSRRGNPYDNACMESFFATLKKELIYRRKYKTKTEAIKSINWFIASFYNSYRRHSKNIYLSPDRFEKIHEIINTNDNYPKTVLYNSHFSLAKVS